MKKIWIAVVLVLVGGGLFMVKAKSKVQPVTSRTIEVEQRDIESNLFLNGSVVTEEVRDHSTTSGELVESVYVKVGDKVKVNDLLCTMASKGLDQELEACQLQLEIEKIRLAKLYATSDAVLVNNLQGAETTYKKQAEGLATQKDLLDAGVISKKAYDASLETYEKSKLDYENTKYALESSSRSSDILLQVKAVQAQEDKIKHMAQKKSQVNIYAGIDGTVTEVGALVGEKSPGVLVKLANFDKNIIKTYVSEADIHKISLGQTVLVSANAVKNTSFEGQVAWISPDSKKLEGKKQAYVEVKVALDKVEPQLRRNFSVNLKIQVTKKQGVAAVKFEGIKTRVSGDAYVTRLKADGSTEDIDVETGIEGEIYVEVISDQLKLGDQLLIDALPTDYGESETLF